MEFFILGVIACESSGTFFSSIPFGFWYVELYNICIELDNQVVTNL